MYSYYYFEDLPERTIGDGSLLCKDQLLLLNIAEFGKNTVQGAVHMIPLCQDATKRGIVLMY